MKTYNVTIIETLEKTVQVMAINKREALDIANLRYCNYDYKLELSNCINTEMYIKEVSLWNS